MTTRDEILHVEEGFICAQPGPNDTPPYGDLVALAPGPELGISASLWPERAARLVAAHAAFVGHDADDFAQLVADAMAFRHFCDTAEMLERTREQYQIDLELPIEEPDHERNETCGA